MSATSEELAAQAEELQTSISFFKVDSAAAKAATRKSAPRAISKAPLPTGRKSSPSPKGAQNIAAQQARARGFALDLSMGGPDADDMDFRESA
jgi:methyl-accepting chemotaxis protein